MPAQVLPSYNYQILDEITNRQIIHQRREILISSLNTTNKQMFRTILIKNITNINLHKITKHTSHSRIYSITSQIEAPTQCKAFPEAQADNT